MASNINFNTAGSVPSGPPRARTAAVPTEGVANNPSDGFEFSVHQPVANAASEQKKAVKLTISLEQLSSQAFKQTLAVLTASGFEVSVALAEPAAKPVHNETEQGILSGKKPKQPKKVSYWDTHDLRNGW